jgi:beta-glucosidase
VQAAPESEHPLALRMLRREDHLAAGKEVTAMGWPIVPAAFTETLQRVHDDYNPKAIYVTENGAAFEDTPENGEVHDPRRVAYLRSHLEAACTALDSGVPLRGYFLWSLMDNFEWAEGYSKRFGMVYVDYATQERVLKDSAKWYKQVVAENAIPDA